jgi:hypothetical protein
MIDGRRRLQNLRVKVDIISRRQLCEYMAGRLPFLPCSGDRLDDEIAKEFDRISNLQNEPANDG